ncbi:MAG: hypothetical protein JXQ82_03165 [Methanomicrobiaceae archaeon]|nr:hypothetical protein [Methanomicrobiaceae archaeon]
MAEIIRAGYIQKTGYPAKDADGSVHQIMEVCIAGKIFAIIVRDLRRTLYTGETGIIWHVKQNWGRHLDAGAGRISLSRSKRAVNILLDNGSKYTVSVAALKNILSGYCSYSSVSEIESLYPISRASYQSAISPWVTV